MSEIFDKVAYTLKKLMKTIDHLMKCVFEKKKNMLRFFEKEDKNYFSINYIIQTFKKFLISVKR